MRIGDLARRTGVSRRLLRYYEEQGLLRPDRLGNGYREYAEADVATVHHIRAMLAAGLSTAVIAKLVHCVSEKDELRVPAGCPTFIGELRRERARITEAIGQLESSRHLLDAVLDTAPRDGEDPGEDSSPETAPTKSPVGRVPGHQRVCQDPR
ncbi:MerR family transcriptional regulator [Streptomyces phaeochromogenes]